MDYKEKYEQALEVAQRFYNNSVAITKKGLEDIFPELKESIDERIKKVIKQVLSESTTEKDECYLDNGVTQQEVFDWLERQGEQPKKHDVCDNCDQQGCCVSPCPMKLIEKQGEHKDVEPTPIFRVGDTIKKKGKDYTFIVDRIQGGYYHCDRNHGAFFPIEEQDHWELVGLKPAWSKEDTKELDSVFSSAKHVLTDDNKKWLQSLKDRVILQPKQEWSEEDKDIKETIIGELELVKKSVGEINYNGYDKLIDWLKSLRPQNTWKPSGEQIRELSIVSTGKGWFSKEILSELLEQLKKLREE